jgi:hypothetical protein
MRAGRKNRAGRCTGKKKMMDGADLHRFLALSICQRGLVKALRQTVDDREILSEQPVPSPVHAFLCIVERARDPTLRKVKALALILPISGISLFQAGTLIYLEWQEAYF